MPLIRNPSFQPPKAITLNSNYAKLLATLPSTVMPPKMTLTRENLEAWIADLERVRADIGGKSEVEQYEQWQATLLRKAAPGFSVDNIMTPTT